MFRFVRICMALFMLAGVLHAQNTAHVRGRVVDYKTGEPLSKALVSVRSQGLQTITDANGQFELSGVQLGTVELYVSTVGYALLKTRIQVADGTGVELEVQLGQDALKRSEQVTVTSKPIETPAAATPSERTLQNTDLRNLSSGLFGDPVRSVHSLPGVGSSDDFYAEFAYRGAGIENIAFYYDGILMKDPFHTIQQLTDLGSVSVVNGDIIESISLLGAAFPAEYGDKTAAVLAVHTREASREGTFVRINADCFQTSATAEGPLGKKASWMVSARKSYLEYLLHRMGGNFGVGYYDTETKLTYDATTHHRFSLFAIDGSTGVDSSVVHRGQTELESATWGHTRDDAARLTWDWAPGNSSVLKTTGYYSRDTGLNRNLAHDLLLDSRAQEAGFRHDASFQLTDHQMLQAGGEARHASQSFLSLYPWDFARGIPGPTLVPVADFTASDWQNGAYVQHSWTALHNRLTLVEGGRYQRFSIRGEDAWLPRASLALTLPLNTRLTAGFGQFAQFPELTSMFGGFPNPALRAERSTHYLAGLERRFGEQIRVRVEVYDREEKQLPSYVNTEWRIENGVVKWPRFGLPIYDSLHGYSRGIELSVERHSANRISGWVSYAYGHARYHDTFTGLYYDSDYDQRHIINAYTSYRISQSLNLSGKYRFTSNIPITGFYAKSPFGPDPEYLLSDQRNQARVPLYSRLDVRLNKACYFKRSKLTLYAEVDNLVNHQHYRYFWPLQVNFNTHQVSLARDGMLPILPSGGLTIEF